MKSKKTTPRKPSLWRAFFFSFSVLCALFICFSCERNNINSQNPDTPSPPLQLPHGKPIGETATAQIGKEGGTLTSTDGTITIEVPAGAVDVATTFSVQEVENVLKSRSKSFRLLPENVDFKKPVTLTYHYDKISMEGTNPDMLFLAYQDKDGNFYWANKTKGNRQNKTLTVQTSHFSDWTFYSQYDLYSDNKLLNGEISLDQGEEIAIELKATPQDKLDVEYSQIQLPDVGYGHVIKKASWDYSPKKGKLMVNSGAASIVYEAPAKVDKIERVYINVTLNGDLGKDNLGNVVQQMQIIQPVVIYPEGYFIISENGSEMSALDFSGEFIQLVGSQLVAHFPNGYNLSLYTYDGSVGGFKYNLHGTPGAAVIELTQSEGKGGMIVMRPKDCSGKEPELYFSPGALNMKAVPNRKGEYFEGEFTVTLFSFGYCQKPSSKSLSGKFRFKKTI